MTRLAFSFRRKPAVAAVVAIVVAAAAAKLHVPFMAHGSGFWDGPL